MTTINQTFLRDRETSTPDTCGCGRSFTRDRDRDRDRDHDRDRGELNPHQYECGQFYRTRQHREILVTCGDVRSERGNITRRIPTGVPVQERLNERSGTMSCMPGIAALRPRILPYSRAPLKMATGTGVPVFAASPIPDFCNPRFVLMGPLSGYPTGELSPALCRQVGGTTKYRGQLRWWPVWSQRYQTKRR